MLRKADILWAMVYLLQGYLGRDGREEAEAMLERHSGDLDKPRILGSLQRRNSGLAFIFHVHIFYRSAMVISNWVR